jgi:hypothetical protein
VNKAFWAIVVIDAALFAFLLIVTLMQPGSSSGGREMSLVFSIVLPAIVIGLAVLLFVRSSAPTFRMIALLIVAGPGILLALVHLRSAYIDYMVRQNASGRGYFSGPQLREMGAAVVRRDVVALRSAAPGADVNAMGKSDMTLMRLAVEEEFSSQPAGESPSSELPVIRALLALGAKPDSGLETATKIKNAKVIQTLLEAGANPNLIVNQSPVAFSWIAVMPVENLRLLVEHGGDLNAKDDSGIPLVQAAAAAENWDDVLYLLEKGADVNHTDSSGRTLTALLTDKLNSYNTYGRPVPEKLKRVNAILSSATQ